MQTEIFSEHEQGRGAFDHGRITEIKPIGFHSGESSILRLGPLFYWAWATAHSDATIPLHPHRGFEIVSYVLSGEIGHYDTLENQSTVTEGGAQLMRTGSGISHEEKVFGEGTEFFQIWFEPDLRRSMKEPPSYYEIQAEEFFVENQGAVRVKSILGTKAPVSISVDAVMKDVSIGANAQLQTVIAKGRALALMTITGGGFFELDGERKRITGRDFVVSTAESDRQLSLTTAKEALRVVYIDVPAAVDYPLLPKR